MNVVIMGPPGGGKGTQASGIAEKYVLVHISSGDMLRRAVHRGTVLGKQVEAILEAGDLVPDALMMALIADRLQDEDVRGGWLLDGFPRTVAQADGLAALLARIAQSIDTVLLVEVDDDLIVERLGRRLTCKACGAVASRETVAGGVSGRCPVCGEKALYQRPDDQEATIRNRLAVYHEKTAPAAARLGETYPLRTIEGNGTPADVAERIQRVLG